MHPKTYFQKSLILQKIIYFTAILIAGYQMNVKIDTKEKFTVITVDEAEISANMTEELQKMMLSYLSADIPHLILNLNRVASIDETAAGMLAAVHQEFYANNASFIVCELQKKVAGQLEQFEVLDALNITPTESEGWDIVQMEEIEREFLRDFDEPAGG